MPPRLFRRLILSIFLLSFFSLFSFSLTCTHVRFSICVLSIRVCLQACYVGLHGEIRGWWEARRPQCWRQPKKLGTSAQVMDNNERHGLGKGERCSGTPPSSDSLSGRDTYKSPPSQRTKICQSFVSNPSEFPCACHDSTMRGTAHHERNSDAKGRDGREKRKKEGNDWEGRTRLGSTR